MTSRIAPWQHGSYQPVISDPFQAVISLSLRSTARRLVQLRDFLTYRGIDSPQEQKNDRSTYDGCCKDKEVAFGWSFITHYTAVPIGDRHVCLPAGRVRAQVRNNPRSKIVKIAISIPIATTKAAMSVLPTLTLRVRTISASPRPSGVFSPRVSHRVVTNWLRASMGEGWTPGTADLAVSGDTSGCVDHHEYPDDRSAAPQSSADYERSGPSVVGRWFDNVPHRTSSSTVPTAGPGSCHPIAVHMSLKW